MRHLIPASLTALSLCATAVADWNTGPGGNPSRDCLSTEVGPDASDILWEGSLPAIVAQQAVIGDGLVIAARIGSFTIPTGTTIVAHDLYTGEIVWDTQLPFTLTDEWRSRVSAVRDGLVYATRAGNTNEAPLYALDTADGSIVWISEGLVDEGTTAGLTFAPNGDPIVGNFGSILRIDKTDGTTVWETPRACPTSNGCLVSTFGDRGYYYEASASGPMVTAIDLASGAELYSSPGIGGGFIQQLGLFVGPDGTVYAPRSQNNVVSDFLVAFEDTGTALVEKWSRPIGYVPFGTMGVGPDGSVYSYRTPGSDVVIERLDPETGALIDESPVITGDFPVQPRMAIDADGRIFFTNGGFSHGGVFSFEADLTLRWSEAVTNVNVGGPAIGPDGILVVCGIGTDLRAYQTPAPACPGDLDGDGVVDGADLGLLLGAWGDVAPGDLNGDGVVDGADLGLLLGGWGACR